MQSGTLRKTSVSEDMLRKRHKVTGGSSIPDQSMWDLWRTKCHCDRFSPPSTSVFNCQFHSTSVPLLGEMKTKLSPFFSSSSQGCIIIPKAAMGP
jgi:hypothetical protein